MRTIHKHDIPMIGVPHQITTHSGAKVLMAGLDPHGHHCVWLEVDDEASRTYRVFEIVGTGKPVPEGLEHCGSFVAAPFVWHVYHG